MKSTHMDLIAFPTLQLELQLGQNKKSEGSKVKEADLASVLEQSVHFF